MPSLTGWKVDRTATYTTAPNAGLPLAADVALFADMPLTGRVD